MRLSNSVHCYTNDRSNTATIIVEPFLQNLFLVAHLSPVEYIDYKKTESGAIKQTRMV